MADGSLPLAAVSSAEAFEKSGSVAARGRTDTVRRSVRRESMDIHLSACGRMPVEL